MNCNACRKLLEQNSSLHCQLCKHDYHYKCVNFSSGQFAVLSKEFLTSWVCPACTNITRRNKGKSNCDTSVRHYQLSDNEQNMNMSFDMDTTALTAPNESHTGLQCPSTSRSSDTAITMDKLSQLMDEKLNSALSHYMSSLREALRSDIQKMVRSEINEALKEVKNDFTETTDFLSSGQKDLQSKIEKQNGLIHDLEKENNYIKAQLTKVENKLSSVDDMSRSLNIEIQAVPENKNENLLALFNKLCGLIGANIDDTSIRACRRVAKMNTSSSRPRNILVTLASPRQRDLVLSAVHRYNKNHPTAMLNSTHLGMPTTSACRIYVAEHLSPELKMLHAETRKMASNCNYKYVWVRFGKIYVRKDDSSGAVHIKDSEYLKKIFQN